MATVRPNWRKYWPGMPGMKLTGTKTATMVKVVAMTARPISSAASIEARNGDLAHADVAGYVFDLHDRVVDKDAGGKRQGKEADQVEREAQKVRHQPEGRVSADKGRATAAISVARQLLQEGQHDKDGEQGTFQQRAGSRLRSCRRCRRRNRRPS